MPTDPLSFGKKSIKKDPTAVAMLNDPLFPLAAAVITKDLKRESKSSKKKKGDPKPTE